LGGGRWFEPTRRYSRRGGRRTRRRSRHVLEAARRGRASAEVGGSSPPAATLTRPDGGASACRGSERHEMAKTGVRVAITLACNECKRRNYQTTKSKRNDPDRVEFSKFCRWCGKHTPHRETR